MVLCLAALALPACTAGRDAGGPAAPMVTTASTPAAVSTASAPVTSTPPARVVLSARNRDGWLGGRCVVTTYAASPEPPPPRLAEESGSAQWYGGRDLWTALTATTEAARLPAGGYSVKIGWWRLADGRIQLRAERLDGPGTASPEVPDGYGSRGFQASGAVLSALGCWRLTGSTDATEISFVALIQ